MDCCNEGPDTKGAPPIFSPSQYAKILKLLGNNKVQNEFDSMVNMADNAPQTISSEWIIDTGANEHMEDWESNEDW